MVERTTLSDLTNRPHDQVFDGGEPRVVRLALDTDESVPAHSHPGKTVVLHVLEGRLAVRLDDETYDLEDGDVARFDGEREIAPEAREPSVALVVLAPVADGTE